MGSAVAKPLTRKHGKIKTNESAVNSAKSSEEGRGAGDCEPRSNSKADPLTDPASNLRKPLYGKPCKVDSDNAHSIRKVCCNYAFFSGKTHPYDSDEEPCPKQLAREDISSPSQSTCSQENGTHLTEKSRNVNIPSMAPPCNDLPTPPSDVQPDKGKFTADTPCLKNAVTCQKVPSPLKRTGSTKSKRSVTRQAKGEGKLVAGAGDLAEDVNPEDQDACRDARTPSPEYDDLEEVGVVNPSHPPPELSTPTPHTGAGHILDTKTAPAESSVSVSISKTEESAPELEDEEKLEVSHSIFKKALTCVEYMEDQYRGAGEPLSVQTNFQEELYILKPETKLPPLKPQSEVSHYEKEDGVTEDYGRLPLCNKSPRTCGNKSINATNFMMKSEADLASECNENNAIRNTDSFGNVMKDIILSGSNRSSATSLNYRSKAQMSDKASDNLSLNHPHVEEILAVGEEFMDEIDDGFPQQSVQPSMKECLRSVVATTASDHRISPSFRATGGVFETGKLESSCSSLASTKTKTKDGLPKSGRGSGAATPVRKSNSPSALGNTCNIKSDSRPSSAASVQHTLTSYGQATWHSRPTSAGQGKIYSGIEQGPVAVEDINPEEIGISRSCSSRESLHNTGAIKTQSTSSVYRQTPPLSSRPVTPRAATDGSLTPRAATDRSVTPRAATDRSVTPRAATDRSVTPRAATDRSVTPRAATDRSVTPRAVTDRSVTPRAATDRSFTPRVAITPVVATDRSITSVIVTDRSVTSVVATDRSATLVVANDRSVTPRVATDRSVTPRVATDRSATLVVATERSATPVAATDRSISPRVTSDGSATHTVATDGLISDAAGTKAISRPPSSKRSSLSLTEQNQVRSMPSSERGSTRGLDSAQDSGRQQPVHSRQSSARSQSHFGLDRCLQSDTECCVESSQEVMFVAPIKVRSRASPIGNGESASFRSGAEEHIYVKDIDSANLKSPRTSASHDCAISGTKLNSASAVNTCDAAASPDQRIDETPVCASDITTSFDLCCLPGICATQNQTVKSLSRSSVTSKYGCFQEHQEEPSQENSADSKETVSPCQSSRSLGTDSAAVGVSSSLNRGDDEDAPSEYANLSSNSAAQTNSLSLDRIGNIRKQLYEEGLKPAEREGGVAFFIPVTEDGLQPQVDGSAVAERLTKTKKSGLNYEERMILANINRQMQLSKRKEFAVRDIRNVKGAASGSEGSDRTKQNDDVDDFDVSF